MDRWLLLLIIVLSIVVIFFLVTRVWGQFRQSGALNRMFGKSADNQKTIPATTRVQDGEIIAEDPHAANPSPASGAQTSFWSRWTSRLPPPFRRIERPAPAPRAALPAPDPSAELDPPQSPPAKANSTTERRGLSLPRLLVGGALIALVLAALIWFAPDFISLRSSEQFVVIITPFADSDNGQTGRVVANELVRVITERAGEQFALEYVNTTPANAQVALDIALNRGADVVVWGSVEPGGLANTPSLRPQLIYTPNGAYAPKVWQGYLGRFAMPRSYVLADAPINGEAVLPDLLMALADLSAGKADESFVTMERLLVDFPLNPTLFRALRGNVLWARGDYEQAASEYRLALTQPSDEQALLANNLGAILLDAGSDAASAELAQAIQLLSNRDLGELRFNLALLALQEGRLEEAVTELEQARNLLDPNVPLLLALTEAYRNTGRLADAQQTLEAAIRQTGRDDDWAPSTFRPLFQQYLSSIVQEQRGLLELAQAVDAYGPLMWQLEIASLQPRAEFAASVDALRDATGKGDDLIRGWRRISAGAADAASITGLVAIGQAQYAEEALNRQRYHLALALIESGRTDLNRAPSLLSAISDALFGSGTHITEAQTLLTTLTILEPMDTTVLIADARLARLRDNYNKADQLYDRFISLAPQQPEGYYGNGLVDRNNGDRGAARQRMFEALERNPNFYPARYTLIQIAEEEGDWPTVLEQARILVEQRPGFERELNLAVALRRSGPSGFDEAEQILVRLSETDQAPVERNRAQALIELGYLHRDADRPAEALRAFEDARRADPNSALAAYELGQMLLAQEDYTAAAEQLQNVVNNDNQHVAAHVALADLYRERLEQPNTAITHYRRALDTRTANADQLMRIGEGLFVLNQTEPAADALRRAAEQEPNNPQLLHSLAQANLRLGRLDAAAQAEQRVLELTAERATDEQRRLSAAALVGLGDVERLRQNGVSPQRQNFGPAIDYYNQALALDPNQVDAIIGLGLVAVAQNNWAVALGHFERANQLPNANEDPQARFWLAEALLRRPDPQRASEIYAQSLEITHQVDFPEAWFGLAQAQYATGDISTASQSLDIALEQRPNYAEALLFRGKLLEEQGRVDEALDAYSASINANNRIAETYYRRGQLYTQQLNYDRAASDFRRATELQPNFAEAFYWLGRSYFAQERMTQALDSFQQAIASRGGIYPEARLHQGLAEEAMQQFSAAAESFRSVIQNDQLSEWADQARLELEQVQEIINNQ